MQGPFKIEGRRWWWPDAVDAAEAQTQIRLATAAMRSGDAECRKQGRRKALFALRDPASGASNPHLLLKENRYEGTTALRRGWGGSKARTELQRAERLAERGLRTPVPIAAGEERRGLGVRSCWLLVPILPEVRDLRAFWEAESPPPRERRALATALGELAASAREAGLFQDDFAPNNVLIRRGLPPELTMIDFERGAVRKQVSEAELARMLSKLARELTGASRADQMRFLAAFDKPRARQWWQRLCLEAPKLMARDLAHLDRTLRQPGRRFEPVREGVWSGWIRRDAPPGQRETPEHRTVAPHESRTLPMLSEHDARRVFAIAVLLGRRGLGPVPRALWRGPDGSVLHWATPPVSADPPSAPAQRALLSRVLGLAALTGAADPKGCICARPGAPQRALWIAPERLQITGHLPPATDVQAWRLAVEPDEIPA